MPLIPKGLFARLSPIGPGCTRTSPLAMMTAAPIASTAHRQRGPGSRPSGNTRARRAPVTMSAGSIARPPMSDTMPATTSSCPRVAVSKAPKMKHRNVSETSSAESMKIRPTAFAGRRRERTVPTLAKTSTSKARPTKTTLKPASDRSNGPTKPSTTSATAPTSVASQAAATTIRRRVPTRSALDERAVIPSSSASRGRGLSARGLRGWSHRGPRSRS